MLQNQTNKNIHNNKKPEHVGTMLTLVLTEHILTSQTIFTNGIHNQELFRKFDILTTIVANNYTKNDYLPKYNLTTKY